MTDQILQRIADHLDTISALLMAIAITNVARFLIEGFRKRQP